MKVKALNKLFKMNMCVEFYAKYYLVFGLFGLYCYHVTFLSNDRLAATDSKSLSHITAKVKEKHLKSQIRSLRKVDTFVHYVNETTYHHIPSSREQQEFTMKMKEVWGVEELQFEQTGRHPKKHPPSKDYKREKHKNNHHVTVKGEKMKANIMNKKTTHIKEKKDQIQNNEDFQEDGYKTSDNSLIGDEVVTDHHLQDKGEEETVKGNSDRDIESQNKKGEKATNNEVSASNQNTDLIEGNILPSCLSIFYPWKPSEDEFLKIFAKIENGNEINFPSDVSTDNINVAKMKGSSNIIEVVYSGEMGNNLFQAALGLILGGLLQYQVKMESIKGFPITYDRNRLQTTECTHWTEITEHNSRRSCESFQKLYDEVYQVNKHDPGHCIRISDGYFQRFALYQPFLSYIRQYMQIDLERENLVPNKREKYHHYHTTEPPRLDLGTGKDKDILPNFPQPEDVVIHVRYWAWIPLERVQISTPEQVKQDKFYPSLDWEYYEKTIASFDEQLCNDRISIIHNVNEKEEGKRQIRNKNKTKCGILYVVCEKEICSSPLVKELVAKKNAIIHSSSALEDFEFLRRATNLILSISTFSWWAVVLSDRSDSNVKKNKIVHYPLAGIYHPDNLMITNSDSNNEEDAKLMEIEDYHDVRYTLWGSSIPGSLTLVPEQQKQKLEEQQAEEEKEEETQETNKEKTKRGTIAPTITTDFSTTVSPSRGKSDGKGVEGEGGVNFEIKYIFHDLNNRKWFGSFNRKTNDFAFDFST